MFRFVIISASMICLSVVGSLSLSALHAAFDQNTGTSNFDIMAQASESAQPDAAATQNIQVMDTKETLVQDEPASHMTENPDIVLAQLSDGPNGTRDDPKGTRGIDSDGGDSLSSGPPLIIVRPAPRPKLGGAVRTAVPKPYRLNRPARTYAPQRRIVRAPTYSRNGLQQNPVPGFLIGVFR